MKNANIFIDVDLTLVDDMPSTCVAPFVYDVQKEESWATLSAFIIERHVDRPVI